MVGTTVALTQIMMTGTTLRFPKTRLRKRTLRLAVIQPVDCVYPDGSPVVGWWEIVETFWDSDVDQQVFRLFNGRETIDCYARNFQARGLR